ncbi:MAG: putative bifunctional diguanylate cyclase/phosphodiesterase, partial [Bradymonadaceae bacterium]
MLPYVFPGGPSPDDFEIDEQHLHLAAEDLSEQLWTNQLTLLVRLVSRHAWIVGLQDRLRETTSENEHLRNRLGLAEKRIQHLNRVFHHSRDPVTGVANREFLVNSLELELEHHQRIIQYDFGFCILAIDNFEGHLDDHGRELLDKALIQMSSRLVETLRTSDRVGRINQQRFGIVLGDSPSVDDARTAATRLLDALSAPLSVEGNAIDFSYSIGLTLSGPQHESPSDVIQDANLAVAESKSQRGTDVTIFDQNFGTDGLQETAIARDMAKQLDLQTESGFYLSFQPIVNLTNRDTVGFEALCRWNHPERGEIEPNKFITIAEQTNLIADLGLWTIDEAGKTLERWEEEFADRAILPFMTINLSKEQIQSEEMATAIIDILRGYEIDPQRIIFELRETATIEHHETAVTNLGQLKSFGVRIAIDDFGVAHTSFASLYRLPVDILKIDRSLVSRLADSRDRAHKIVRHLIDLCEDMNLISIAEGVETEQEHDAITELGCDFAQGYAYDHALSSDDADRLLESTTDMDTSPIFVDDLDF